MFDDLVNSQHNTPALARMGRHLSTVFMISTEDTDWIVTIHEGEVIGVKRGPFVMPSFAFRLVSTEQDWGDFLEPVPLPGRHDLMALVRRRVLRFEGNLHPLMSHLLYFKLLLATLRPVEVSA